MPKPDNPSFVKIKRDFEFQNIRVFTIDGNTTVTVRGGTTYLYCIAGCALLRDRFSLTTGMYAAMRDGTIRTVGNSLLLCVTVVNFQGMFQMGGEIERSGRLQYIDGCTDTCLISPLRFGDPCLNYLHFPPGIRQSAHTHPSLRVGVVARGEGLCVTPFGDDTLMPGDVFAILPSNGQDAVGLDGRDYPVGTHCFFTTGSSMEIVAFHQNSDWGPTDESHPMLAQTHLVAPPVPA